MIEPSKSVTISIEENKIRLVARKKEQLFFSRIEIIHKHRSK